MLDNNKLQQLINVLNDNTHEDYKNISEQKKRQAAYALNLCTVSVSQIIDYKDINILQQEYDSVLNNINLEYMPKDDALLEVLKRILDTITFFKIQEGEKKLIETEYQNKMKNAIWSSVPNFGLIVAGGSVSNMAISLASQIGIGYMNYRCHKNEYGLEKDRKLWELQKTAIDQFNALRRELFNTAWRLADAYGFPDEYRLTEKQIKQYNEILIDDDPIRKYERLESIKENFEAYPPFWYFIGNAANSIHNNKNYGVKTRFKYKDIAKKYFEKYETINEENLLREDQIASACALEHIDILLEDTNFDKELVNRLLKHAIKFSGKSNDVLQLCSLTYLKINNLNEAEKIFKILVNEDYNAIINAQLLSSIYANTCNVEEYDILKTKVDEGYLYPMPTGDGASREEIEDKFLNKLKNVQNIKFKLVFNNLLDIFSCKWNKVTSTFDYDKEYEDTFFYDNSKSNSIRLYEATKTFSNEQLMLYYQDRLKANNYEIQLLDILNELFSNLFQLSLFSDYQEQNVIISNVKSQLLEKKLLINSLQNKINTGNFSLEDYKKSQTITLKSICENAFKLLLSYCSDTIEKSTAQDLPKIDAQLVSLCSSLHIAPPEIKFENNKIFDNFYDSNDYFGPELFGYGATRARKNIKFLADMAAYTKDQLKSVEIKDDKLLIYYKGDDEFKGYFKNYTIFKANANIENHSLAILKTKDDSCIDLILTDKGILNIYKNKLKNLTPYNEIKLHNEMIILFRNFKFQTKSCDINKLYNILEKISNKFICGIDDKVEYISGQLTASHLTNWFKSSKYCDEPNIAKYICIPTTNMLEHMGYIINTEFDEKTSLLQFMIDKETNAIISLRLIKYDEIDSALQSKILEKGTLEIKN